MPSLSDGISIDSELVWHRFVRKHQASAWVGRIIIKLHKYPIYCFFIDVSLVPSIGPRSLRPNMTRYFLIPPSSCLQVSKPLAPLRSSEHHRWIFCFVVLVVEALTVTNTDCWARDEIKIILHASSRRVDVFIYSDDGKVLKPSEPRKRNRKIFPGHSKSQRRRYYDFTLGHRTQSRSNLFLSLWHRKFHDYANRVRNEGKTRLKFFLFFSQNHAVKRESNRSSVFVSLFWLVADMDRLAYSSISLLNGAETKTKNYHWDRSCDCKWETRDVCVKLISNWAFWQTCFRRIS